MRALIVVIILLFSFSLSAQSETARWKAKNISYAQKFAEEDSSHAADTGFFSVLQKGYRFLVSDYDGDNCPFVPSCSRFLVLSVKRAGILQGFLMFADRFTRDLNYFNRGNYPKMPNGKLYDPPEKHLL